MTRWSGLAALLFIVNVVAWSLPALGAEAPVLDAPIQQIAATFTIHTGRAVPVRCEREAARTGVPLIGYDGTLFDYRRAANGLVDDAPRATAVPTQSYDGCVETRCSWKEPTEGAVYDSDANAAEGFSVAGRTGTLADAIPAAQSGRITMGVGLAEDASGAQRVLIGTSEPGGYLRPGVTLAPGETMAAGAGHAESDIVNYANANGLRLLEVGATRPICPGCAAAIRGAGAVPVTPLKGVPW